MGAGNINSVYKCVVCLSVDIHSAAHDGQKPRPKKCRADLQNGSALHLLPFPRVKLWPFPSGHDVPRNIDEDNLLAALGQQECP